MHLKQEYVTKNTDPLLNIDERFHASSVTNMIRYFHTENDYYSLKLMFSFDNHGTQKAMLTPVICMYLK